MWQQLIVRSKRSPKLPLQTNQQDRGTLLRTGYRCSKTIRKRSHSLEQMGNDCCSLNISPNYPIAWMTDNIPAAVCKILPSCEKGSLGKLLKVPIWIKAHLLLSQSTVLKLICSVMDRNDLNRPLTSRRAGSQGTTYFRRQE